MKKLLSSVLIISIFGISIPFYAFAQSPLPGTNSIIPEGSRGEEGKGTVPVEAPATTEEAKSFISKILSFFPNALKKTWEAAKNILQKFFEFWSSFWDNTVQPWLKGIWDKLLSFLGKEIEERRPAIKEEFEKEKEAMKESIKEEGIEVGKSLWEKFKDLIR